MDEKEIKKLFPIFVVVPEIPEDINIGEQLLRANLPEELLPDIFWGLSIGAVGGVPIKTEQEIVWQGERKTIPLYLQKSEVKLGDTIIFKLRTR